MNYSFLTFIPNVKIILYFHLELIKKHFILIKLNASQYFEILPSKVLRDQTISIDL